jgi:hypothetical protein
MPTQATGGRWRTFAVYAVLGPILGAVLPAVIAVAILSRDYSGPLWISSPSAWLYLIGSAFIEGLIPAALTAISLRVLPGRARPRVRSAIAYALISAIAALILLLPFRALDETGHVHLAASAVLGASGFLAGFLCAVVVQRRS